MSSKDDFDRFVLRASRVQSLIYLSVRSEELLTGRSLRWTKDDAIAVEILTKWVKELAKVKVF